MYVTVYRPGGGQDTAFFDIHHTAELEEYLKDDAQEVCNTIQVRTRVPSQARGEPKAQARLVLEVPHPQL